MYMIIIIIIIIVIIIIIILLAREGLRTSRHRPQDNLPILGSCRVHVHHRMHRYTTVYHRRLIARSFTFHATHLHCKVSRPRTKFGVLSVNGGRGVSGRSRCQWVTAVSVGDRSVSGRQRCQWVTTSYG